MKMPRIKFTQSIVWIISGGIIMHLFLQMSGIDILIYSIHINQFDQNAY